MRSDGTIYNSYLDWIMDRLYFSHIERTQLRDLCDILMEIPYEWNHDLDENRASDGLYLRNEFLDEEDLNDPFGSCTVLEMLAEFAIRIDEEYIGDPSDPNPGDIFIEFLENLGLIPCKKRVKYFTENVKNRVKYWMDRDRGAIFGFYKEDGYDFDGRQIWDIMFKWVKNR